MASIEIPKLDSPQQRIAWILHHCARSWRQALDRKLRPHGFSQPTWMLLTTLLQMDESATQRDLADRLGIEGPTLVGFLDRLEKDGLVERRMSGTDRRAKTIHILPAGHEKLKIIQREAEILRNELLKDFSTEELEQMESFLTRLRSKTEAL